MKIQCDVCEKAPATLICCADEAALCDRCDVQVHAANKLASKHQRLHLNSLSNKLPPCDICQDKTAFIFCVEDRALFCKDCDESIHSAGKLAANHQRFLATGIRVALSSGCTEDSEVSHHEEPKPPTHKTQLIPERINTQVAEQNSSFSPPSWGVDDLLQLSDFESSDKKGHLDFGELEWFQDIGFFGDQYQRKASTPAEVPQLPVMQSSNHTSYRQGKFNMSNKKPRLEIPDDEDDDFFTVPDLG